jgi:RNA polymerase sigma-70 factor (ECF subfamily)
MGLFDRFQIWCDLKLHNEITTKLLNLLVDMCRVKCNHSSAPERLPADRAFFSAQGGGSVVNSGIHSTSGATGPSLADLKLLTDEQLMARLQEGVNDCLAVLFDRYQRLVFSIALKIVRDRGEAEDVTQTVFLEIYRSVAQFDPAKGTLKIWLLQFAYHRAFNRKQHLNIRNFYSQESADDVDSFTLAESTPEKYAPAELQRLMQQGLASLGESQKRVIELASYDGLSMKEIADKTGNTLSNVRHHYYRGLKQLRSFMTRPLNSGKIVSNDD